MSQVKGRKAPAGKSKAGKSGAAKAPAAGAAAAVRQTRDASSILLGLVILAGLVIAVAAWMGGSISVLEKRFSAAIDAGVSSIGLSVNRIDVIGAGPATKDTIIRASAVEPGQNMFRIDLAEARTAVLALDEVATAQVFRHWPNQVLFNVTTTEPAALWQRNGRWVVVGPDGNVLPGTSPEDVASLPRVVGVGGGDAAPALFRDLAMFPEIENHLLAASRVGNRRWDLKLKAGHTVHLPEPYDAALVRLRSAHVETGLLATNLGDIDLRDNTQLIIRRPTNPGDPRLAGGDQ